MSLSMRFSKATTSRSSSLRSLNSTPLFSMERLETVMRMGMPSRSASLNLTPGDSLRSS